ncbi:MAG: HAD family hydrolase [Candidatus Woesearchaeota archaeon]
MIKAVLFDSWGTLLESGVFPSPIKQVQYILRINMPFHEFVTKFETAFMIKKYANLNEAFEEVCKEFQIQPKPYDVERVIGMWNKNMLLAKPFPETIQTLERLKKNHKLAIISNTDPFSVEPVLEKFDMRKFFDVIACSYEIGFLKTDPKMFGYVLRKLHVKKDEVIMVGDSMQSDILGAEKAGIKPVLIDRKNTRTYDHKITNLSEVDKYL